MNDERNFCPRCGKRTNGVHTCTPPSESFDAEIFRLRAENEQLKRGEFICQKCGLRKDSKRSTDHEF